MRTMTTLRARTLPLLALQGVLIGCLDKGPTPPALVDTSPPNVEILSPNVQSYDEDGDHLVDLRVTWRDTGGTVAASTVRVQSLEGVAGSTIGQAEDLLKRWRVERLDSGGLLLREALPALLHGGLNHIVVSVADTAGNVLEDTVEFALPPGAFHKTLSTGLVSPTSHGIGVTVCVDDHRVYMAAGRSLVVADADSLTILGIVRDSSAPDVLKIPLCVPGDPILYVTERVERFDRPSIAFVPRAESFISEGITQSRSDANHLYVGETISGTIGIIDRAQARRVGQLLDFAPQQEFVFDVAVLAGDAKLYATRYTEGGILVIDPQGDSILGRIAVGGPRWPDLGSTDDIALSSDDRWLYAAVLDGDPRGVIEIDTRSDSVVRTLALLNAVPQALAISPSGKRIFVTTQDQRVGTPSDNVLVDIGAFGPLAFFPRPRPAGEIRFDGGVAFHPNGMLVFVAHNLDIDVYLNRE
jgi:DNA-binding beta-propeller fold protein YncE